MKVETWRTITLADTILPTDKGIFFNPAVPISVVLHSPRGQREAQFLMNLSTSDITITMADSSRTINGSSSYVLSGQYSGIIVIPDNLTNWIVMGASIAGDLATALALKAPLASPAFTTPNIGAATGASLITTSAIRSSGTAGIGYDTGAGGAQTQLTDKSTTVVSNTITTAITLNNAELVADTTVAFTFTNARIAATDTVICTHSSTGTSGAYSVNAFPGAGSAVISVRNNTAGNLSEAIVLRVTIIKSVSS